MGNPKSSRRAASSAVAAAPVERFFDAVKGRPDYCCTGHSHVLEALRLYSVTELMVSVDARAPPTPAAADNGFSGRSSAAGWQAWAEQHKAKLQIVQPDTSLGKKFCEGVVVGALLSRVIDEDLMDSMMEPYEYDMVNLQRSAAVSPSARREEQRSCHNCPPKTQPIPKVPSSPREEFFLWLRASLDAELDNECSVEGLLACTEVLVQSAEENMQDVEEVASALMSAEEVLRDEGALRSAESLSAHWYAIMEP